MFQIDALCARRSDGGGSSSSGGGGGGGTRVHDNVVSQLLTKIDGLEQQSNLLVIGLTNRKDLIDEAILRPGRLEVLWADYIEGSVWVSE